MPTRLALAVLALTLAAAACDHREVARHDDYRRCAGALRAGAPMACPTVHLCANEASLDEAAQAQLRARADALGCPL